MKNSIKIKETPGKVALESDLAWFYAQDPVTDHYVAVCPKLNITLEAESQNELFSLMPESVEALFNSLVKTGDLHNFLVEKEWNNSMASKAKDGVKFTLPLPSINPVPLRDLQLAACG